MDGTVRGIIVTTAYHVTLYDSATDPIPDIAGPPRRIALRVIARLIASTLMFSPSITRTFARHALQTRRHMSVRPSALPSAPKKTTIARLADLRASKSPISVLTAYDFPTARACSAHPVDITLVGDSLAQVCLGYPSTTRLTLDEMLHHCRAVARGTTTPLLVADMPFGTYASSPQDAVRAAVRMVQEGHIEAVKLEGGQELVPHVIALTQIGIPVMAHIGLLPQRSTSLSGYRVQGRTAASAESLVRAAQALENAGAFAIVLEAMPSPLGEYITRTIKIPTIGIGAGPGTSGQVLVWDDMLGTWHGHKAKWVYANPFIHTAFLMSPCRQVRPALCRRSKGGRTRRSSIRPRCQRRIVPRS